MALVRWDPFRELEEMSSRLDRLFGRNARHDREREGAMADWAPPVDISETEREYLVKTELPSVDKNDVRVEVENGALRIHGERKQEQEAKGTKLHRVERYYGSFMRSFALPEDVDDTKISADFKDGMLTVHLPKGEAPKPQSIAVKVS